MPEDIYQESLKYHTMGGRPGKTEVVPTKPCLTQHDLSLAYSPGVAEPCRVIAANEDEIYHYTNKGNLVAVISNGTAVLGLGDIGAPASKPVMEGKAVLFKRFADIDVFDIEVSQKDPEKFIEAVHAISISFGGINLEDIASPHCFYIEEELKKRCDIPVFHDDQHGTAIIAAAAFLNAIEVTGRKIGETKCVFNGAGAAGQSVAKLFLKLGVKPENMVVCDKKGPILASTKNTMDIRKLAFASRRDNLNSLADALKGADVFVGCSVGNCVTADMVKSMADNPVVFAMANPTPEIDYLVAKAARPDVIMATGRSDYPNQVNNVLGFPFIFRGALDTFSRNITEEMKLAAVYSLAALAREPVPEVVSRAYGGEHFSFGREYLIPKPFDPRVLYWVSVAVAKAAMECGVARKKLDLDEYRERLRRKVDAGRNLVSVPLSSVTGAHLKIAIPSVDNDALKFAIKMAIRQQIAIPVLVGKRAELKEMMSDVPADTYEIVDPSEEKNLKQLTELVKRQRPFDNVSDEQAKKELADPYIHATILTEAGMCDGLLAASHRMYAEMVKPILVYASVREGVSRVAGMHLLALKDKQLFFADTTLIEDPSAEELAEVAARTARLITRLGVTPTVAFVSFTNFPRHGSPEVRKLDRAIKLMRRHAPEIEVFDGPVQADVALEPDRFRDVVNHKMPEHPANVLIFPNLAAANAAFRLTRVMSGGSAIGPVLLGLNRPCNVMPMGSTEDEIVNMLAITASIAKRRKKEIAEEAKTAGS